jgi:hypothetical protein
MFKKIQYVYLLKKIYKMGCLDGRGVPVPYIERTVPKSVSVPAVRSFSATAL